MSEQLLEAAGTAGRRTAGGQSARLDALMITISRSVQVHDGGAI